MCEAFDKFKKDISDDANKLVKITIPQKILELNKLIEDVFKEENLVEFHQSGEALLSECNPVTPTQDNSGNGSSEVGDRVDGTVSCNEKIVKLIRLIKPHAVQLAIDSKHIILWMQLTEPKSERRGGSFYFDLVQDITMNKLALAQQFTQRGDLIKKCSTYPDINDYKKAIQVFDDDAYMDLKKELTDVRDGYSILLEVGDKYLEILKNPRNVLNDFCI